MQASPAKYNLAFPTPPSTTRRAHAACGAVCEAGEMVAPRWCCFQGLCLIGETPMQASPAKYNLALPTLPSATRCAHAACGAFYAAGEMVAPRWCCFQGLCLIGETPMQASPAKYNLALPTTPAECNSARPCRLRHFLHGDRDGRAPRSRAQGTVLKHSGLLMLGVDGYCRSTSMVNAGGLADDAVGDVELAEPAAVKD